MKKKYRIFRENKKNQRKSSSGEPVSLLSFTIGYVLVVLFLLLGLPAPNTGTRAEIPYNDIPLFTGAALLLYIFILVLFAFISFIKKKW